MSIDPLKVKRYAVDPDLSLFSELVEANQTLKSIAGEGERGVQQVEIIGAEIMTIKGAKGDKGDKGEKGEQGLNGKDGRDGKDGKDGRNGIDGKNGRDGMNGKNGEKGEDGFDGSPDDPEEVVEKVNASRIKIRKSQIEGLDEEIGRIEKVASQYRGGGTSAAGVAYAFKSIAHTEEPTGLINGVNTTYTVQNNIWWIFGFTLNGEQIAELPNFTYVNKTITFSTALPAAYSGKDFEVKYIGT